GFPAAGPLVPGLFPHAPPVALHHLDARRRLLRVPVSSARSARTSAARLCQETGNSTLFLVRPFVPCRQRPRPRLTSRSSSPLSSFQAQSETSPGRNARHHCTTAGSTPPILGHQHFAVIGPLALIDIASYPVLVHRPAIAILASSPRSVTLPPLSFTLLAVASSRDDLHLQ